MPPSQFESGTPAKTHTTFSDEDKVMDGYKDAHEFVTGTERIAEKLIDLESAIDYLENLADSIIGDEPHTKETPNYRPKEWSLADMLDNLPVWINGCIMRLREIECRIAKSLQLRE
jgi:hypothetical protein